MYHNAPQCVEKFIEHIEGEVKRLYATFLLQPMTELIVVLKREHEATEKCHICFKEFSSENRKVRDHWHYTGFYREAAYSNYNLKYLFIKELGKKLKRDDIGDIAENKEKCISFNVKINVEMAGVSNKNGKEVRKFSWGL